MYIFSVLIFSSTVANANYELPVGEPRIECTVVEILSNKKKFGKTSFPKLYDIVYNDNLKSQLFIGGKEFTHLNPQRTFKGESLEKIKIQDQAERIDLEIKGKPISRNGILKINGKWVANITCH